MVENLSTMYALIIHTEALLETGQELITVEFGDGMLTGVGLSKMQAHQIWSHLLTTLQADAAQSGAQLGIKPEHVKLSFA